MKFKVILFLSFFILASGLRISAEDNYSLVESISSIDGTNDDIIIHTVLKGQTVYTIASIYHIPVKEIYRLNPKAERGIKEGEKLKIARPKTVSSYSDHLIEAKETMFSVSRLYNISVDDLKNANPGLDENSFKTGRTIKIPQFNGSVRQVNQVFATGNTEYRAQKGDTLYSIGKKYNVSVEALMNANPSLKEGLKEGMLLVIPKKQEKQTTDLQVINRQEIQRVETPYVSKGETVRIGILLPFLDEKGSVQKDKLAEYYEGFLLAVKDLKEKNLNAEIYSFDIGPEKDTKKLESLLGTTEMNNLHFVIGGISKQQIKVLSDFSKKTGIKYIIPFGSTNEINTNQSIFQMTTSPTNLNSEIISAFINRFRDYNIVFVRNGSNSSDDKLTFVQELQKELKSYNIDYQTVSGSTNLYTDLKKKFVSTKKNIIVPASSSEATLSKVIVAAAKEPVSLFGYPEWQIYAKQAENLHKYDTYIYSIFFLNENESNVQNFINNYKKWYNKNLINSYPKFGCLGYDTGLYFLTAVNRYGSSFELKIPQLKVPTIQSAVYLKRVNNKGGYINNGLYFVHYKTDSTIEKIDVSR
ncbi:MAG: LysM peptidoglycan-binding domain-containing protein [Dysgonomonas sp.]|nr:LysM peptidoglycan-binding domain-containing protein [Dysgonomonas sp.]